MVSMKSDNTTFQYIGNNLAIDFLNTRIIDKGEEIELLNSPQDLFAWAKSAGISMDNHADTHDFTKALEFREALNQAFVAILDNRSIPSKGLDVINKYLVNHGSDRELKKIKGQLEIQPIHKKLTLERFLGLIANEAALLLTSNKLEKLKRCA